MLEGSGRCRCSACRARCCAAPSGPAGRCCSRGSPTAATAPTAGCCPGPSRARCSRTTRRDRRPGPGPGRDVGRLAVRARRQPRARSTMRAPYDGPSRAPAGRCGASESPDPRPQTVAQTCGEAGEICGGDPPCLWSILWDQKNVGNIFAESLARLSNAGHRTLPTDPPPGLAGRGSGIGQERRSTPRGNLRRRPGDGDGGVGEPVRSRGASPSLLKPRASWCSYHREALTLLPSDRRPCRTEEREPISSEDPHREATCGVGPVTGTAGSEQLDGEVGVTQPPQPEGLLVLIPPGDSHNSDRPPACRWETGAGHGTKIHTARRLRRRPGDGVGGVGETVRSRWASPFRLKAEGPLDAHTIKRPSPFALAIHGGRPHHADRPTVSHLSVNARRDTVRLCAWTHPLTARAAPVGRARPARRGGRQRGRPGRWRRAPGPPGWRPTRSCPVPGRSSSTACRTPTALAALLAGWSPERRGRSRATLVEVPVDLRRRRPRRRRRALGHRRRRASPAGTARPSSSSAFCGFAPGFAYLAGLPGGVRRAAARHAAQPRVPAGSVALAGSWCGVYPTASPGGWRLLGRTDATLWDPSRSEPGAARAGHPGQVRAGMSSARTVERRRAR